MRRIPKPGDVIQIELPNGSYAYGRVYREGNVSFYKKRTKGAGQPPIGSRSFLFQVAVFDHAYRDSRVSIVGVDPFEATEDAHPGPKAVQDPFSGQFSLYLAVSKWEDDSIHVQEVRVARKSCRLGLTSHNRPASSWKKKQVS